MSEDSLECLAQAKVAVHPYPIDVTVTRVPSAGRRCGIVLETLVQMRRVPRPDDVLGAPRREDVMDVPPCCDEGGGGRIWQATAVPPAVHFVAERDDEAAAEVSDGIGVLADLRVIPAPRDFGKRDVPRVELDQWQRSERNRLLRLPPLEGLVERVEEFHEPDAHPGGALKGRHVRRDLRVDRDSDEGPRKGVAFTRAECCSASRARDWCGGVERRNSEVMSGEQQPAGCYGGSERHGQRR